MKNWTYCVGLACTISIASLSLESLAEDWPQWRGPNRDGISKETGWLSTWPAAGPKQLWTASVGIGYSSFSISKGRLYTMGNVAEKDYVYCLDAETGQQKWAFEYACPSRDPNGYHGTRCTPTVDGNYVYTLSREGHFFCLDTATGQKVWAREFKKDFGGKVPRWGFAGSPLIEKDWVLTEAGGPGASVVAMNKLTGEVIWKAGSEGAGYSSLVAFDLGKERLLLQFAEDQLICRRMANGSELWKLPWKTSYGVNSATPIIQGDEAFISSGYGFGCARIKITPQAAQEVWRNKNMKNHVNSCVLVDGHLYGYDESELKCLDWKTGEVKWGNKNYGKGALMYADGKLILYSQTGKLGLAEASPEGFKELASFQALTGKDTWANPVLANGRIYIRSLEKMMALDVKK